MSAAVAPRPAVEQVWSWLGEVEDPEIPVISIVDLGIVRDVAWDDDGCIVALTPTYSGCPATAVIEASVVQALRERGLDRVRVVTRIAPPWTTDWLSEAGRSKLRAYGIAPPIGLAAEQRIDIASIGRGRADRPAPVPCPRCDAVDTELVSAFGSTPCKALYRCRACREPFDHFKCH